MLTFSVQHASHIANDASVWASVSRHFSQSLCSTFTLQLLSVRKGDFWEVVRP